MHLNTNKCKSLGFSRQADNRNICDYYIQGSKLELVASYKYLEIHITNNLPWQLHVNFINNANRMLGYLRRNFYMAPSHL